MSIFSKLFKKEDSSKMTQDEKQIEEAKKDIAEKGADSQTEKDRVDESVGEQERLDGNENTQNAKDRVDESEGTEKADEKRAEERKEEQEEKTPEWATRMLSMLEKMTAAFEKMSAPETKEETANAEAAKKLETAFGVNSGVFPGAPATATNKNMSPAEVAAIVRKIM